MVMHSNMSCLLFSYFHFHLTIVCHRSWWLDGTFLRVGWIRQRRWRAQASISTTVTAFRRCIQPRTTFSNVSRSSPHAARSNGIPTSRSACPLVSRLWQWAGCRRGRWCGEQLGHSAEVSLISSSCDATTEWWTSETESRLRNDWRRETILTVYTSAMLALIMRGTVYE